MKLYAKKLDSLEALKREKIRLRYERRHSKASDLNPISEIGGNKSSGVAKTGLLATVLALASSRSQLDTFMTVGRPLWRMISKRRAKAEARYAAAVQQKPSFAKRLITDVVVSYIIGKALQVSVQGLRVYLRRKNAKKLRVVA